MFTLQVAKIDQSKLADTPGKVGDNTIRIRPYYPIDNGKPAPEILDKWVHNGGDAPVCYFSSSSDVGRYSSMTMRRCIISDSVLTPSGAAAGYHADALKCEGPPSDAPPCDLLLEDVAIIRTNSTGVQSILINDHWRNVTLTRCETQDVAAPPILGNDVGDVYMLDCVGPWRIDRGTGGFGVVRVARTSKSIPWPVIQKAPGSENVTVIYSDNPGTPEPPPVNPTPGQMGDVTKLIIMRGVNPAIERLSDANGKTTLTIDGFTYKFQ